MVNVIRCTVSSQSFESNLTSTALGYVRESIALGFSKGSMGLESTGESLSAWGLCR